MPDARSCELWAGARVAATSTTGTKREVTAASAKLHGSSTGVTPTSTAASATAAPEAASSAAVALPRCGCARVGVRVWGAAGWPAVAGGVRVGVGRHPAHSPGQVLSWTRAAVTIQCQSVEADPPRAPAPHVHSQCQRPSASHATAGWWLRRAVRLRVMVLM